MVNNQDRFLNFGNKDKTHPKFLDPIVPYVPPKAPAKAAKPPQDKSTVNAKEKSNGKTTTKLENWWRPKKRKNVTQKRQKVLLGAP